MPLMMALVSPAEARAPPVWLDALPAAPAVDQNPASGNGCNTFFFVGRKRREKVNNHTLLVTMSLKSHSCPKSQLHLHVAW